jgi:hypothetical protein
VNTLARLAIIFAGIVAAGAFLNLYILAASFVLTPALDAMGLKPEQTFSLLYWLCFAAGAVTAFFVMRPIYRSVGKKKNAGKGRPEPADQKSA